MGLSEMGVSIVYAVALFLFIFKKKSYGTYNRARVSFLRR